MPNNDEQQQLLITNAEKIRKMHRCIIKKIQERDELIKEIPELEDKTSIKVSEILEKSAIIVGSTIGFK